jgi:hypothetical protein
MVTFAPVDLPTWAPGFQPDEVDDQIHGWIASPPMRALVAAFGGVLTDGAVGDLLSWLDDFSGTHWDFRARGGVERWPRSAASGHSPWPRPGWRRWPAVGTRWTP